MDKGFFGRKDRLIKEDRHDTYREQGKYSDPTVCAKCGAFYARGRWSWNKAPGQCHEIVCPACRRIADKYPAGTIILEGPFFKEHREEILNLTRNVEAQEKNAHPMERIMDITHQNDHTIETTTGIHIARRIGEAIARSYKGELTCQYNRSDKSIRVWWRR
jgi:NMD protein affecting ribosome stability and mRNA decay